MPQRAVYLALACLFLAFAAYGSLVPLDLHYVPFEQALARFRSLDLVPLTSASKTDLVANVLLFIPAGFFLAGALLPRSRTAAIIVAPFIVALLFAASVLIEFSQLYSRVRNPSLNDIVNETTGGALGVIAWFMAGPGVSHWLRSALSLPSATDRLAAALIVYAAGWAFLAVLPLDFTLRVQELAEKYRAGRIIVVPFAKSRPVLDAVRDLGGAALAAAPIGALAVLVLRQSAASHPAMAILLGAIAVAALEGAQLFVMSRTADTTDVLAGVAGVAAGVALTRRWLAGEVRRDDAGARVRLWPLGALTLWFAVLAIRHWAPFDFTTDYALVRAKLPDLLQVPFRNYYAARPLDALAEASTKILLAVPVGLLLRLTWRASVERHRVMLFVLLLTFAAALFLLLEVGQVFLPSRFPDGTDVILGLLGAAAGAVLIEVLHGPTPRNL